jgi:antitoxin (DNA-binding transcriptional repressor) of toxin-antitoxin stability system
MRCSIGGAVPSPVYAGNLLQTMWWCASALLLRAFVSPVKDLIDRAQRAEAVVITRDGKPAAELRPLPPPGRSVTLADLERLDQHRMPRRNPAEDAGFLMSRMRDEEER